MKKTVFALARSSQDPQNRPQHCQSSIINYQLSIPLLLLLVLLAVPARAKYSGGAGTPENPYKIADYNDLYTLADDINDYNKCFIMSADIDLDPNLPGRRSLTTALIAPDTSTSGDFQGIAFTGTFDGNDCNILNFTIDTKGLSNDYLGLFGRIGVNGVIEHLGVENVNITGGSYSYYLGGLVGYSYKGIISNCRTTGSIRGYQYIGGLVGQNWAGTITKCSAAGSVSGYIFIGGLIGENERAQMVGCRAFSGVFGRSCVGGLVGRNGYGASISGCNACGTVIGRAGSEYIGGLVGSSKGSRILYAYSTSDVSGGENVGGLVGYSYDSTILSSFYTGSVHGGINVGGLLGNNSWSYIVNCYASGEVFGLDAIGGLIGYQEAFLGNSYAIVTVSGGPGATNVGGLVGVAEYAAINNCYFLDPNYGGGSNNGCGTMLTADQMRNPASFVGWDFLNQSNDGTCQIWTIRSNDAGPVLSIFHGYVPAPLQGSGSVNDPYLITDANDLGTICYRPDASYKLTGDIDLAGIEWSIAPIPDFAGTFDGNDCRILNLFITGGWYLGLFGKISRYEASISDLALEHVNITGQRYIGGLVGNNSGIDITNCHTEAHITGTKKIGGLIGHQGGGRITHCNSDATLLATDGPTGGLLGSTTSGKISNSSATCNIISSGDVGGLIGFTMYAKVTRCCATVDISGDKYLGGLVGSHFMSSITDSYAVGALTGNENVGGLVGWNGWATNINCYSTASVLGNDYVGGLLGQKYGGTVSRCYFLDPNDGGGPDNGIGQPLTDNQMKQKANFIKWDFTTPVWIIDEGVQYPLLWWQDDRPVAVPGPNQIAYASLDGLAEVTLDGNDSYDPDGDPLEYLWTWRIEDNIYEVNGVSPTIELPVGRHTIELVVSDRYYDSEPNYVIITVIEPIEANIRIVPRVLNLKSSGRYVLCFIKLPEDYSAADIDRDSIRLEGQIEPRRVFISEKFQLALVFFSRSELQAVLKPGRVELALTGRLTDGTLFDGAGTIRVINPRRRPWHRRRRR